MPLTRESCHLGPRDAHRFTPRFTFELCRSVGSGGALNRRGGYGSVGDSSDIGAVIPVVALVAGVVTVRLGMPVAGKRPDGSADPSATPCSIW